MNGTCNCDGCSGKGCVGPITVFGKAVLAGFLSKSGELNIPGTVSAIREIRGSGDELLYGTEYFRCRCC